MIGAKGAFLIVSLGAVASAALAGERYPAAASVDDKELLWIDMKRFGAVGDGRTDNTAITRKAIQSHRPRTNKWGGVVLYFPAGTYLFSDSLIHVEAPANRFLYGDGPGRTVLKLKDNCGGFGDPSRPKAFWATADPAKEKGSKLGNAFRNSVYDVTIDVGAGNTGAVGLYYMNNNQGCVQNVVIRSSDPQRRGVAGLSLSYNWPGPGLLKNVRIIGFDYGIYSKVNQYSITMQSVVLEGQRTAGIQNTRQKLFIHGLTSRNAVPAIRHSHSLMVLIDADLTGGKGAAAIENGGLLYARSVRTAGYGRAIASSGERKRKGSTPPAGVEGTTIDEYVSHGPVSLFPGAKRSLHLPIRRPPEIPWEPPGKWANVRTFRKEGDTDLTAAIQRAVDSGAATVYFPRATYDVSQTIAIRANVRRIIGLHSRIDATGEEFRFPDPKTPTIWRFDDGAAPAVVIERFDGSMGKKKQWWMEHNSKRTLVVRHCGGRAGAYRNSDRGTGDVFIEDCVGSFLRVRKQNLWGWQVNAEWEAERIVNDGGKVWVLGLKTEGRQTNVVTRNGGSTELLGAYLYPYNGTGGKPAFTIDNARASLIWSNSGALYDPAVVEIRGREKRTTKPDMFEQSGRKCALYVGYESPQPIEPPTGPSMRSRQ